MGDTATPELTISLVRRLAILGEVPALSGLTDEVRLALAESLDELQFGPGDVVVAEGERGDRLYLVVSGRAEATVAASAAPIPVATLQPGELFGEVALLMPSHERHATVTAKTRLTLLTLAEADFRQLMDTRPDVREQLQELVRVMATVRFLKRATPFAPLGGERLKELSGRLEQHRVEGGEEIVRQGDPGDSAFLIVAGRVEARDGEQVLSTLGPGTLFGEVALLTGAPRSATVLALEPCELLEIRREHLLEAMGVDARVEEGLVSLLRLRDRPRQTPGVEAHERRTADGERFVILKHPDGNAYYRLAPEGYFVWRLLDGEHGLRDLTLDYLREFGTFAPQVITDLIADLARTGFLVTQQLSAAVREEVRPSSLWGRLVGIARRVANQEVQLPNADALFTKGYEHGIRIFFTPLGLMLGAILALGGIVGFVLSGFRIGEALSMNPLGGGLAVFLAPAYLAGVLAHEAGHAFATKACGRSLGRAAVGLYRGRPVVYVDTSDMWLAGRKQRIVVSLAGPYANVVTGGTAGLMAMYLPNAALAAVLWQFALMSYVSAVRNLNPMWQHDGYYVLMDVLDRPNLRAVSLEWLINCLPAVLRRPAEFWEHRVELLYGVGVLAYALLIGWLSSGVYRLIGERLLARLFPAAVADSLAAFVAAGVVLGLVGSVIWEGYAQARR